MIKFSSFVNEVLSFYLIKQLSRVRSATQGEEKKNLFFASPSLALQEKCRVRLAWLIKHLLYGLTKTAMVRRLENQGPRFGKLHRYQKAKT